MQVGSAAAAVDSAKKSIPFEESVISSKAAKVNWVDILVEILGIHFFLVIINVFLWFAAYIIFWFLSELTNFFEFLAHVLLNRSFADQVQF